MKIVCIGDSITYGYSLSRKDTWVSLSQEKTGFKILNKGINGDTVIGMLSRFERDVLKEKPDIMFFMGGSNDIFLSNEFISVKSSLSSIVRQSIANRILPVIATPIPFFMENISDIYNNFINFSDCIKMFQSYRNWILEYSNLFDLNTIDYFYIFNEYFKSNNYNEYYLDGLHLNRKGNELFAKIFCDKIKKIVEKYKNRNNYT